MQAFGHYREEEGTLGGRFISGCVIYGFLNSVGRCFWYYIDIGFVVRDVFSELAFPRWSEVSSLRSLRLFI